jgi:hypothetical protein
MTSQGQRGDLGIKKTLLLHTAWLGNACWCVYMALAFWMAILWNIGRGCQPIGGGGEVGGEGLC